MVSFLQKLNTDSLGLVIEAGNLRSYQALLVALGPHDARVKEIHAKFDQYQTFVDDRELLKRNFKYNERISFSKTLSVLESWARFAQDFAKDITDRDKSTYGLPLASTISTAREIVFPLGAANNIDKSKHCWTQISTINAICDSVFPHGAMQVEEQSWFSGYNPQPQTAWESISLISIRGLQHTRVLFSVSDSKQSLCDEHGPDCSCRYLQVFGIQAVLPEYGHEEKMRVVRLIRKTTYGSEKSSDDFQRRPTVQLASFREFQTLGKQLNLPTDQLGTVLKAIVICARPKKGEELWKVLEEALYPSWYTSNIFKHPHEHSSKAHAHAATDDLVEEASTQSVEEESADDDSGEGGTEEESPVHTQGSGEERSQSSCTDCAVSSVDSIPRACPCCEMLKRFKPLFPPPANCALPLLATPCVDEYLCGCLSMGDFQSFTDGEEEDVMEPVESPRQLLNIVTMFLNAHVTKDATRRLTSLVKVLEDWQTEAESVLNDNSVEEYEHFMEYFGTEEDEDEDFFPFAFTIYLDRQKVEDETALTSSAP